jgi:archaemetzincin
VAPQLFAWIERAAADWFPFPIRQLSTLPILPEAYDPARRQYRSVEMMKALSRRMPADAARVLGVTEADLSIPMLTFLFGQAQLDGPIALISLCRLRQEFYGLPPDDALLRERIVKEILHELGHTFGLTHCADTRCAMSVSTHVEFVDVKSARYCPRCGNHIARRAGETEGAATV